MCMLGMGYISRVVLSLSHLISLANQPLVYLVDESSLAAMDFRAANVIMEQGF